MSKIRVRINFSKYSQGRYLPFYFLGGILAVSLSIGFAQVRRNGTGQTRPRTVSPKTEPSRNKTANVSTSEKLQASINAARCGETIVLEAGTSYVAAPQQSFVLPFKPECATDESAFITITTSALSRLPEGYRVKPADSPAMAKLVTSSGMPVVYINKQAHHYRFSGIEFTNLATATQHAPNLVLGGDYAPAELVPHHIEFDRCFFHPIEETTNPESPLRSVSHALSINGKYLTLTNSYISGFMGRYKADPSQTIDSMGIIISNAPYLIENNYIAAWYNNILIGGSDPAAPVTNQATVVGAATLTSARLSQSANLAVGDFVSFQEPAGENANGRVLTKNGDLITFTPLQVNNNGGNSLKDGVPPNPGARAQWNGELPTDIKIRSNTFDKPMSWKGLMGESQPKGWIEIKLADGLVIEGNVFQGYPSVVGATVKNQSGTAPWSTVRDVKITNNRFTSFSYPFIFNLRDELRVSTEGRNVVIANNLCTGAGGRKYYGIASKFVQLTGGDNVQIFHNTCLQESDIVAGEIPKTTNFVYRDNITNYGTYGMNCMSPGGMAMCWPRLSLTNNVIIDTREDRSTRLSDYYPANNFFPLTLAAVGFVDITNGDFRLSDESRYKGKATDGKDPGVDMEMLNSSLARAK